MRPDRNLGTWPTEPKRATRNGGVSIYRRNIKSTRNQNVWCIKYSTNYYQLLTVESWFNEYEQMPLNRSHWLPAPYKRLIDGLKQKNNDGLTGQPVDHCPMTGSYLHLWTNKWLIYFLFTDFCSSQWTSSKRSFNRYHYNVNDCVLGSTCRTQR